MKPATKDSGVIRDEENNVLGINLGWDFTAEHEWGIQEMQYGLGCLHETDGPDRYLVIQTDRLTFTTVEIDGETWNVIGFYSRDYSNVDHYLRFIPKWGNSEVKAAWAEYGFVAAIQDQAVFELLKNAVENDDIILTCEQVFASENNPFSGSGLKLMVRSTVPQAWEQAWVAAHEDNRQLKVVSEATGIQKRLAEADKKYFALSPRWKDDGKTEVIFWLNPMEQHKNNYGWFTVEDLEAWIRNEGPIPMNAN